MIAPAQAWERVNNIETPQLYAVFPWRMYGVGKEGLEIARNTYLYDPDAQKLPFTYRMETRIISGRLVWV